MYRPEFERTPGSCIAGGHSCKELSRQLTHLIVLIRRNISLGCQNNMFDTVAVPTVQGEYTDFLSNLSGWFLFTTTY
jgi:hypothetical protein